MTIDPDKLLRIVRGADNLTRDAGGGEKRERAPITAALVSAAIANMHPADLGDILEGYQPKPRTP